MKLQLIARKQRVESHADVKDHSHCLPQNRSCTEKKVIDFQLRDLESVLSSIFSTATRAYIEFDASICLFAIRYAARYIPMKSSERLCAEKVNFATEQLCTTGLIQKTHARGISPTVAPPENPRC